MDWARERQVVLDTFTSLLAMVTKDGSVKRQAGLKPPWWRDESHEAAIFSHLNKWKHGELVDPTSGTHPLVHLAWRALAIAYQESRGKVDPDKGPDVTTYAASGWDGYYVKEHPYEGREDWDRFNAFGPDSCGVCPEGRGHNR